MGLNAIDLKNDDTLDAGVDLITDNVVSLSGDVPITKILLGAAGVDGGLIGSTAGLPADVVQLGGTAISTNTGTRDAGTQRVTIATNDVVPISSASALDCSAATITVDLGANNDVHGQVAHDAAASGSNPVHIGAEARSSEGTAVANGDVTRLMADLVGRQIVGPYAPSDLFVSGNGNATGTADTAVIAAGGVGVRNYVTTLIVTNTSATDTFVVIKDGVTELIRIPAPANSGAALTLPTPLATSANTALNFASGAGVTTMYVGAVGYQGR